METSETKRCNTCHETKPLTEFYDRDRYGHKAAHCKICHGRRSSAYYKANCDAIRSKTLFKFYGITLEDYADMLAAQSGRCAACGVEESGRHRFAVDHDHACCPGTYTCGSCIRGLLCTACNTALGHIENGRYEALLTYLGEIR